MGNERSALAEAWEKDNTIRSLTKSIENHHKAVGQNPDLSDVMAGFGGGIGALAMGQLQKLPTSGTASGPSSARPVTGSVRRMPLGAAASLALNKEKLTSTLGAIKR